MNQQVSALPEWMDTDEVLRQEVRLLIQQHRAATPGSLTQSLIGRKLVAILIRLGQWTP